MPPIRLKRAPLLSFRETGGNWGKLGKLGELEILGQYVPQSLISPRPYAR